MNLSVIIPTYNEEKNIAPLLTRIDSALKKAHIHYEVIFIDDHSTDNTRTIIRKLKVFYPIKVFKKVGEKGKATSLIEGFYQASYEVIAMIDADLQYAPELIPQMVTQLDTDDIVIAHRTEQQTSLLRKFTSRSFMFIFGRLLHNLPYDIQSGLKVFKKEIIKRISLNPTPWTFDLEFLVKARNAGYRIGEVNTTFFPREYGSSHVKVLQTSYEIGLEALKLKMRKPQIVKFLNDSPHLKTSGFNFKSKTYTPYTTLPLHMSAFFRFTPNQKKSFLLLLLILGISFTFAWHATILGIVALLTALYFSDIFLNLYIILKSFTNKNHSKNLLQAKNSLIYQEWPSYTILCPLYKEVQVLPTFIKAMQALDYPKEKLQVLLLLEENDTQTIDMAQQYTLPKYFQTIIVPHSLPKTKPKACNYGLFFATGEYSVIYDAEDNPEIDQLKKSVLAFRTSTKTLACVQAKLNFYNPRQNILTRLFTTEYSLWFDMVLVGLQTLTAPIPLGGTSNHFKTNILRELQGWDSFNVTEDCDIGIRLAKKGYSTAMIDSTTYEEANSQFFNWFNQRSRWIKGYMQTYLVHIRDVGELKKQSLRQVLFFHLIVGGKILSLFINPLMWIICISYFALRASMGSFIESFFPAPVLYMAVFSIVFGNFMYLYYYMLAAARRGYYNLIIMGFVVPLYWLMMSIAAMKAGWQLLFNPHYWAKTKHGLHLPLEKQKKPFALPNLGLEPQFN